MSHPPRYYEGLTPEEAEARRLQFSIQAMLSSDDPTAYREAPGDDREGIRKSRYTLQYRGLYGDERQSNPVDEDRDERKPRRQAAFCVYRNLHTGGWSVRYRGRVIEHLPSEKAVVFDSMVFSRIEEAGKKRAMEEQQRNVHAYLCAYEKPAIFEDADHARRVIEARGYRRVSYAPFSLLGWHYVEDKTPFRVGEGAILLGGREVWISNGRRPSEDLRAQTRQSNPRDSADPPSWLVALENKAQETGAPLWALIAVYRRGLAAWRTGHRPGANAFAWGMARVNSFLVGGKTFHGPDRDIARAASWTPRTPNPTHTIYPFLSVDEIARWIPLMRDLGVSEVARSERGFLTAYQDAKTPGGLPEEWVQKRNAYIARRLGQMDAQATPLFFERGTHRGLPTRAHLSLIAWAYSPDPSGLAAIRSRVF